MTVYESPSPLAEVQICADEFAFQWAWTRRERRNNVCLAVSRALLECSLALYKSR